MNKKHLILLAVFALLGLGSCNSNKANYNDVAAEYIEATSSLMTIMLEIVSECIEAKNFDEEAVAERLTNSGYFKILRSIKAISCFDGEACPKKDTEETVLIDATIQVRAAENLMESYKITRSAELRDGNVALIEVDLFDENNAKGSTVFIIAKKIGGKWKIEVNAEEDEIDELKQEVDSKLASGI